MLNILWAFMLLLGISYGACTGRISEVSEAVIESSSQAVTLALGMVGIVALWCGIMEMAKQAGVVRLLSRLLKPVIIWLFPNLKGERGLR